MGNEIVFIICSPINSTTNSYAVFNPISYFSLNPSQRHFLPFYFGQRRQKLISGQKTLQLPSRGVHFLAFVEINSHNDLSTDWKSLFLNSSVCSGTQNGPLIRPSLFLPEAVQLILPISLLFSARSQHFHISCRVMESLQIGESASRCDNGLSARTDYCR
jgi:hypothetical protein